MLSLHYYNFNSRPVSVQNRLFVDETKHVHRFQNIVCSDRSFGQPYVMFNIMLTLLRNTLVQLNCIVSDKHSAQNYLNYRQNNILTGLIIIILCTNIVCILSLDFTTAV